MLKAMFKVVVITSLSLGVRAQAPDANLPNILDVPLNVSKEVLVSHGFSFDSRERPMCEIGGSEGSCRVEAFVWGEKAPSDPAAHTCSKLDKASYVGHCAHGQLEGLSLVIADGSTKEVREAYLSYFVGGRISYPALISYLAGTLNFGMNEEGFGYGCVYFGKWDAAAKRCGRFIQIYGADIFTESNAQKVRDGSFDLPYYREKFLNFLSAGAGKESVKDIKVVVAEGKVVDGLYSNSYFGLTLGPSNAHFTENTFANSQTQRAQLIHAQGFSGNGNDRYELAILADAIANSSITSADDFVRGVRERLENDGFETVQPEFSVAISGVQFTGATMKTSNTNNPPYRGLYSTLLNGYIVSLDVSGSSLTQLEDVLKMVSFKGSAK